MGPWLKYAAFVERAGVRIRRLQTPCASLFADRRGQAVPIGWVRQGGVLRKGEGSRAHSDLWRGGWWMLAEMRDGR